MLLFLDSTVCLLYNDIQFTVVFVKAEYKESVFRKATMKVFSNPKIVTPWFTSIDVTASF